MSVLTTAVSTFANRAFCRIESLNTIQALRRAAGDGSGRKYSEKYVFMTKNMTFGPLGYVLTLLKEPPNSYFLFDFFHLLSH